MSLIGIGLNLLLATLLASALAMGWRLNRRLQALRDSHDGFAIAVRELNAAAARAEQGLADLRGATDEAVDELADRIEKGRALATRLERLIDQAPAHLPAPAPAKASPVTEDRAHERRLGILLAAAREARSERAERPARRELPPLASTPVRPSSPDDDLFDDAPLTLHSLRGDRR